MKDPVKASKYISSLIQQVEKHPYAPLLRAWNVIIGEKYLGHAIIDHIQGETLVVTVDHPAWITKLHMEEQNFLRALKRKVKEISIKKIHFILSMDKEQYQLKKNSFKKCVSITTQQPIISPKNPTMPTEHTNFDTKVSHIIELIKKNYS